MRPMTRQRKFSSVNKAGVTSEVRTSIVARATGSAIRGRSISASIGRSPSRRHIRRIRPAPRPSSDAPTRRRRAAQVLEADLDGAVASAEGRVEVDAQAGDGRQLDGARRAVRQFGEARFRCRQRAGQELAFGPVDLERESELMAPLPRVLRQQGARRR